MAGEIEVDESYFGGVRKGKRGRGAAGKIPVFGLLKRGGRVYAVTIQNARSETLIPIIESKIRPDSIVYTDSFKAYDILDVSDFHHVRINHSKLFAKDRNHINGIENFWNQAKRHLRRYNGIPKHHFNLYLKECEWRFNYRPTANPIEGSNAMGQNVITSNLSMSAPYNNSALVHRLAAVIVFGRRLRARDLVLVLAAINAVAQFCLFGEFFGVIDFGEFFGVIDEALANPVNSFDRIAHEF